jgi:N-acylneuraminate cytidylyltransferase
MGDDGQMFEENGSIYLTKTSILMDERCRLGGKIVIYPMSTIENIDIDTEQDFLFASAAIQILGLT